MKGGFLMAKKSSANEEEMIRKYSSMVYKIAYSATSSRADSDDIYQNVFLRYIKKKPLFTDENHEKAWFIRVTVNCSKSFLSKARNNKLQPLSEEMEYHYTEKPDIAFAMKQLTPKTRTVIYLYYYEGYSAKEIAEMLNMGYSAVRTSLLRGRERLKFILEKEGYDV